VTSIADALRGLKISPKEISSRSRLSIDRVEAILSGQNAAISEVRAIASGLRIPLHLLARTQPASEGNSVRLLFRDTKKGQVSYDLTVEKVASYVEAALEILPLRTELPGWLQQLQSGSRNYAEADRLAKQFRRMIFDDYEEHPATDLFLILGSLEGVVVSRLDHSRYEGVSLIAGNYCFIFVSPRFAGRMLFSAGHELGHIATHHQNDSKALFEEPSDIGSFGHHSKEESFVDAFSSCLLLPDVGIGKSLKLFREHFEIGSKNLTDLEILFLARFYGVSFEVAARRCEDLGLLPAGLGHSLAATLRKEFGSPEKRADALGIPSRANVPFPPISVTLAHHLSSKINLGDISIGWAADRLGVTIGEILAVNVRAVEP
jgi:Zn-dependent peptidase ImmA (M78 family)